MVVYAVGSAGLAVPDQADLRQRPAEAAGASRSIAWAIVGVYLLKGIGSYVSSYLMADVGQRVVMDLRNALFRHILGQSAGFFAQRHHRPAAVAHQQRRRPGAAGGVGDGRRSRARVAGARRLRGAAVLLRRAARARLPHRRAARSSIRWSASGSACGGRRGAARRRSSSSRTSAPRRSPATASSRRSAPRAHEADEVQRAPATSCSART